MKHLAPGSSHTGRRQRRLRRARARRGAIAVGAIVTLVLLAQAPTFAASRSSGFEASARLGDCTAPVDGQVCHYVSAGAQKHFVQLEFTTIELREGSEVFLSDVLCNVDGARVRVAHHSQVGRIDYAADVPAADCDFLMGESPSDVDVQLSWTGSGPFVAGDNDCTVSATINGSSDLSQLFCSVLIS